MGDGEALNDLLARFESRVLDVVRIRLGQPLRRCVESCDIVQETLVEAFRGFERYEIREDAQLVNWLSKIAERRILRHAEHHRAEKRDMGREVPLLVGTESSGTQVEVTPPDEKRSRPRSWPSTSNARPSRTAWPSCPSATAR